MSSSLNSFATEPVFPPVTPETIFKCNHCEESFKIDKELRIHIGQIHKPVSSETPEKERSISVRELEVSILTLIPP